MIERPRHCSTMTPCTFCAESTIASVRPATSRIAANSTALGANPANERITASSTVPIAVTARAPAARIRGAAAAAARIAPIGKQMTRKPKAVLDSPKASFTSG